jgi:DNA-directed RNA polymerase specialized sigma subunit
MSLIVKPKNSKKLGKQTTSKNSQTSKTSKTTTKLSPQSSPQKFGEVAYYAGLLEWDGWKLSPLETKDRIYFSTVKSISLLELKNLFPLWEVRENSDGSVYVTAKATKKKAKQLSKESVSKILNNAGIAHSDIKYYQIERRNLNDLPRQFTIELIKQNSEYATKLIYKNHLSMVEQIITDKSEIPSIASEIVIELAESYNEKTGVPFRAYLALRLNQKLVDKARSQNGRTLNDFKTKLNRILQDNPHLDASSEEISKLMKLSDKKYRSRLSEIQKLNFAQNPSSINLEDESGNTLDISHKILEGTKESIEEALIRLESIAEVAYAMKTVADKFTVTLAESAAEPKSTRKHVHARQVLLGMKIVHLKYWEDKTPSEISEILGCTLQTIRTSEKKYIEELQKLLDDH